MFFWLYFFSCWKQMLSVICCSLSLPTPGLPQQPQWTGMAWGSPSWQKSSPAHRTHLSAVLSSGIGTGVTELGLLVVARTICEEEHGQEKRGGRNCLLILRLERCEGRFSLPRESFPWHLDGKDHNLCLNCSLFPDHRLNGILKLRNTYGETWPKGWSSLEVVRERLRGGNGDSKVMENTWIWIDPCGFLHIADDCCLQIIFFISYSSSTFDKKKTMYKSVRLKGTIINLTHVAYLQLYLCQRWWMWTNSMLIAALQRS